MFIVATIEFDSDFANAIRRNAWFPGVRKIAVGRRRIRAAVVQSAERRKIRDRFLRSRGLFDLLSILVTACHFLAANLAVGGPILALWLHRCGRKRNDPTADACGRTLLRYSLWSLYLGAALGAMAAYLWWRSAPNEVVRAFWAIPRSRYEFGLAELIFSALLWGVWLRMWRSGRRPRLAWWLGFAGVTNVAYHFPTLFAMLSVLSTRALPPDTTVRFVALLLDGEVLSRTVHFLLASTAVGGAMLFVVASRVLAQPSTQGDKSPEGAAAEEPSRFIAWRRAGARWALVPTLLQWGVGVWVLAALPVASREGLLGGDVGTALVFGLSLAAVVALMHHAATAAFDSSGNFRSRALVVWMIITIVLMTAVRHYARKPYYAAAKEHGMKHFAATFPFV